MAQHHPSTSFYVPATVWISNSNLPSTIYFVTHYHRLIDMEPDKAWKNNLYKTIEGTSQTVLDDGKGNYQQCLAAARTKEARGLAYQEYHKNMNNIHDLATESFEAQLTRERQERMWTKQKSSATKNYPSTLHFSMSEPYPLPTPSSSPFQNSTTTLAEAFPPAYVQYPSGKQSFYPLRPRTDSNSPYRRSTSVPDLAPLNPVAKDLPPNLAAWRDQWQLSSLSGGSNTATQAKEGYPRPHKELFSSMKTMQPLKLQRVPPFTDAHIATDPTDELLWPLSEAESGPSGLDDAVGEEDPKRAPQKEKLQEVEETSQQRRKGEEWTYGEPQANLREQEEESRYREIELERRELEFNHREEQAKRKEIEWIRKEKAIMKREEETIQREQAAGLREEELREEIRRLQEKREEMKRKEEGLRELARRLEAEREEVRWREEALRKREEELQRRGTEVTVYHDQQRAEFRRREDEFYSQQEDRSQLEEAAMEGAERLDREQGQLSPEGQGQMKEPGVGDAERSKMGEIWGQKQPEQVKLNEGEEHRGIYQQVEHNLRPGDTQKFANGSSLYYPSNGKLRFHWTSSRTNTRGSAGSSLLSTRTSISSSTTIPEQNDDGITNWQRRQEELYRKQQEQFRKEQERLEFCEVLTRKTA